MDYEKKYNEALERARVWKEKSGMPKDKQGILNDIFPELKESEDERIKHEIKVVLANTDLSQFALEYTFADMLAWLEKQGDKDSQVKLPLFTFDDILALQCCMETAKKVQEDKDLYERLVSLHDRVHDAYHLEKQGEQNPQRMISAEAKEALYDKPVGKAEQFDKYEGLSDFERTLADICIGWIGEEPGWKQYIKDNSDVLLRIATEKFKSVQDAPSEQKPAWSEEDERILDALITSLNNEVFAGRLKTLKGIGVSSVINWLKSIKHS